jgi:F0F1-type ATP synthase alpha subunit
MTSNSFIGEVVNFYNQKSIDFSSDVDVDVDSEKTLSQINCEGCIFEMSQDTFKILLLRGDQTKLCIGDNIYGTSKTIKIKVGLSILGKTITPFGDVISHHTVNSKISNESELFLDDFFGTEYRYIAKSSPSIIDRKKVSKPFLTGINSVDCLFPIGLGQRQLIIGDNNTGKTSLALSTILNQNRFNNKSKARYNRYYKFNYFKPCIYVSIGQKRSEIIRLQKVLANFNSD